MADCTCDVITPSGDNIRFVIAAAEKMRLTTDGKLGIGTSTPGERLHLLGGHFKIENTAPHIILREMDQTLPDGLWRIVLDSNTVIINQNKSADGSFSNHEDKFKIHPDARGVWMGGNLTVAGQVGIGTTSPTTINSGAAIFALQTPKTEILTGTDTGAYQELVTIRHTGIESTPDLRIVGLLLKLSNEQDTTETRKMGGLVLDSSNAWANYPSLHLVTDNTRRVTVDFNGLVGIGTTNPGEKLEVSGNIKVSGSGKVIVGGRDAINSQGYCLRTSPTRAGISRTWREGSTVPAPRWDYTTRPARYTGATPTEAILGTISGYILTIPSV